MDLIFKKITFFKFEMMSVVNVNCLKLIIININNKFIFYCDKEFKDLNELSPNIYFKIYKNQLKLYFSHLFYDGYSIFYILNLIDKIYIDICDKKINYDELKNNLIFNKNTKIFDEIYHKLKNKKFNFNYVDLITNLIKNDNNIFNFIYTNYTNILEQLNVLQSKPKKMYIKKNKIIKNNKLSSILLFNFLQKKIKFNKYNIVINARKIFSGFDDEIMNFIYISRSIKNENDLKKRLNMDSKNNFEILKYQIHNEYRVINSYMSFVLPSFIKKQIHNDVDFQNIFVFPTKDEDPYVKVIYKV